VTGVQTCALPIWGWAYKCRFLKKALKNMVLE